MTVSPFSHMNNSEQAQYTCSVFRICRSVIIIIFLQHRVSMQYFSVSNKNAKSNSPAESSTNTFLVVTLEEAARRVRLSPGDRHEEAITAQKPYDEKHKQDWSDWDGSSGSRLCSQTKGSRRLSSRSSMGLKGSSDYSDVFLKKEQVYWLSDKSSGKRWSR